MFTLIAENEYNQRLEITHNPAYIIKAIDGLNPPEAIINTTFRAGHDGSLFNSAYLDNRLITITIAINGPAERNRNMLYPFFQCGKRTRLYYKNGMRDVYIDGYAQTMPIEFFAEKEIFQASLLCPDPLWHDLEDSYATNDVITNDFSFPFSIEEEGQTLGSITRGAGIEIENRGQTEIGVFISLSAEGSFSNPVITNANTGEFFGVNTTLASGDLLTIDSTTDGKGVFQTSGGTRTSKAGLIKSGSTWLKCRPGINRFTLSGSSGSVADILFSMTLQNCYQGV